MIPLTQITDQDQQVQKQSHDPSEDGLSRSVNISDINESNKEDETHQDETRKTEQKTEEHEEKENANPQPKEDKSNGKRTR